MNRTSINTGDKSDTSKRALVSNDSNTTSACITTQGKSKQPRIDTSSTGTASNVAGGGLHHAESNNAHNQKNLNKSVIEIFDVAETLSLEPGSRIEVRWDLNFDDIIEEKQNSNDNTAPSTTTITSTPHTETRWWGGTLLPDDKRMFTINNGDDQVTVPIRSIDYDPYPPCFPDRSIEDVCFLSNHSLLNMSSDSRTCWRVEGDDWEPSPNDDVNDEEDIDDELSVASSSPQDGLREVLNSILKSVLEKPAIMMKMQSLDRNKQSMMATRIAATKERLVEKLLEKLNNDNVNVGVEEKVITPELVQIVMAELANELNN